MCVIVMQPAGAELSGNKFRNCWSRNPDGGGYAFTDGSELVVKKGYFEMKQMLEEYRVDRQEYPDSPFLLHFRIATVGPVNGDNTHPFWVRKDLVMAHNGTITGFGDSTKSDSLDFAQTVLASLKPGFEEDETIGWLIEKAVGYNKIALLRADGAVTILNEAKGHWADDLWFSNDSYKKVKFYGNRNAKPLTTKPVQIGAKYGEVDLSFLGLPCVKCEGKMDLWDCELAEDYQASVPVCYDCISEFEPELVSKGLIADWMSDPQPLDDEDDAGERAYRNWLETNEFYLV